MRLVGPEVRLEKDVLSPCEQDTDPRKDQWSLEAFGMGETKRTLSKQKTFSKVLYSVEMTEYQGGQCRLLKDHAGNTLSESVFCETGEICTYPTNRENKEINRMPGISRGDMGGPLVAMKTMNGRKVAKCLYGVINSHQVEGDLSGSGPMARVGAAIKKQKPLKYTGWGKHVRVSAHKMTILQMKTNLLIVEAGEHKQVNNSVNVG